MALMRVNVQKTSLTGLAAEASVSFAHGLGAAPDIVRIRYVATIAPAGAGTVWYNMAAPIDAANVTVYNIGSTTSPDMEVLAIRLHSEIQ